LFEKKKEKRFSSLNSLLDIDFCKQGTKN